jgi:hypothetical protein
MEFAEEERPRSAGSPSGKEKKKEIVRNLNHRFTIGKSSSNDCLEESKQGIT